MTLHSNIDFNGPEFNDVVVVGIVRNISTTFEDDFSRFNQALSVFKSVKWFLVESDSEDDSIGILEDIAKSDSNFDWCSLGKLDYSDVSRAERLALARNRYVEELRNKKYKESNIVIVADFNGLSNLITSDAVSSCWTQNAWTACTANQSGRYYDIWALRHKFWSPNDCWKQHAFISQYARIPELTLYSAVNSRMIHIPADSQWIEVDSAFGGFAIYDATVFRFAEYSGVNVDGDETCEHVHFNNLLRKKGGKIYINPMLINAKSTDHSMNASFTRSMLRIFNYPIKLLKKVVPQI